MERRRYEEENMERNRERNRERNSERRGNGMGIVFHVLLLLLVFFSAIVLLLFWRVTREQQTVLMTEKGNQYDTGWRKEEAENGGTVVQTELEKGENEGSDTEMEEGGWQEEGTDEAWKLTLVNRWNPIPENYEVSLAEVEGGECVDARIYEPLMEMLNAAREGNLGQLPIVVSGYRTQAQQQELYDEKIAEYKREGYGDEEAEALAGQWVSVPGYSEHQLGLAVDINGAVYDVYQWLQDNSYKYGFIFRYAGSKSDITGISEEVWHYRYVGVETATEIYESGVCLEEYLEGDR